VTVPEFQKKLMDEKDAWVLDVRTAEELEERPLPSAAHIPLGQLPVRMSSVPRGKPVYLLCSSGQRTTTAASLLQKAGWRNVSVVLGGADAWYSKTGS